MKFVESTAGCVVCNSIAPPCISEPACCDPLACESEGVPATMTVGVGPDATHYQGLASYKNGTYTFTVILTGKTVTLEFNA